MVLDGSRLKGRQASQVGYYALLHPALLNSTVPIKGRQQRAGVAELAGCNRVANLCGTSVQLLHKGATMTKNKKTSPWSPVHPWVSADGLSPVLESYEDLM